MNRLLMLVEVENRKEWKRMLEIELAKDWKIFWKGFSRLDKDMERISVLEDTSADWYIPAFERWEAKAERIEI